MAFTWRPEERVRRRPDFERAYKHGMKCPGRFMTVFLVKNDLPVSRLGVAASRKLGGAVTRNRAKRRVREVFRLHKIQPGLDVIVIPRREMLQAEFASLEKDYQSIVSRRASRALTRETPGESPGR